MDKKNLFEFKIQPILEYIGAIGAALMTIAYIVTVFVLINGFETHRTLQITIFSIVNAAVGFVILQFLKIQGQAFAENLPENKEIQKQYNELRARETKKKPHSITKYWITSIIKDVLVKVTTVAATSIGIIYIVIEGSNDWNMLFLAIVNLILFLSFGLLGLNKTYNYYNNEHIPYLKEKIKEEQCLQLTEKHSET